MKISETFKCSGQILSNSLCQFRKDELTSLQILYLSSVSSNIILLYFFSSIYTLLIRSPLKWNFLRLSSAQVKSCQIPSANFERTSRFLSKFCISLLFHEILFLSTFLAQIIYTLLKRNPLNWKSLRLLSTCVKICQIPYTNFETTSQFLSKFCIFLQFHEKLFLSFFLARTIYTLLNRSPWK